MNMCSVTEAIAKLTQYICPYPISILPVLYRDPIREQAAEFISKFKHQGGSNTPNFYDTNESALSVANKVGIDNVIAKARPQDKLNFLNQLDKIKSA